MSMPSCSSLAQYNRWEAEGLATSSNLYTAATEGSYVCILLSPCVLHKSPITSHEIILTFTFQLDSSEVWKQEIACSLPNTYQSHSMTVNAGNHSTPSYSPVETLQKQPGPSFDRPIDIRQARYVHPSKKGRTRYGRPINLEPIAFCLIGSCEEGVLASDAFDAFRQAAIQLEGADYVVFKEGHATNITMHILVRLSSAAAASARIDNSMTYSALPYSICVLLSGPTARPGRP